jgi:tetratricopeptide (TPR) repeat protein
VSRVGGTPIPPAGALRACALVITVLAYAQSAHAEVPAFVTRATWVEFHTPEYTLVTDASPGVRADVRRLLRRFSRVLQATHPGTRTRTAEPTWVYLFREQAEMDRYRPQSFESVGAWYSAAERGNLLVLSGRTEGAQRSEVVLHEFVHLFVHANYDAAPAWLNEGLAQYYSTAVLTASGGEIGLPEPYAFGLMGGLREPMAFDLLFAMNPDAEAYRQDNDLRNVFYAQSHVLVHMLQSSPARSEAFAAFLARLRTGTRARLAFRASFPESTWKSLAAEMRPYCRNIGAGRSRHVALATDTEEPATEQALSAAEALTRLGELSLDLSREQLPMAAEHFRAALVLDPAMARAQVGLGVAEDMQGNAAEAERNYRLALKGTISDPWIPVSAGRGTMQRLRQAAQAQAANDTLAAIARQAHGRFSLGMALDPDDFEGVVGCATTTLLLGLQPDTMLVRRLEQVAAITPGRADVTAALAAFRESQRTPSAVVTPAAAGTSAFDAGNQMIPTETESLGVAHDLIVQNRVGEARALYVRMRDRNAAGSRARGTAESMIAIIDAEQRLKRAHDLYKKRQLAEAERLLSPAYPWPDDPILRENVQSLRNGVRAELEIERVNGLVRAGKVTEARAALTKLLGMEIPDEMKSYIRGRIQTIDAAQKAK